MLYDGQEVTYTPHMLNLCCVGIHMVNLWRLTIHRTLLNIMLRWSYMYLCCVGGLTCTTHFQIYVVFEVLDIVLEVYHIQHIFKYTMYVLLEVVDVVLEVYHTQHTFKHMLCWR